MRIIPIPACAGNIKDFLRHHTPKPVHPRLCGEHKMAVFGGPMRHGSSPLVRGTCNFRAFCDAVIRFIPACAGNILFLTEQNHTAS